jgi:asparagine synthase (glutamine-hydrolysing)
MSAVVGIYHPDGRPADRVDLERMLASLAHRGPDGMGAWCEGPVGLGQLLLRTTPEALHEELPLANARGDLVIAADARLDNRQELLATLAMHGHQGQAVTDAALILAAYEKWGEDCPAHLLGDFAFAMWDRRAQSLFCARDPMGVRSLYYHYSPRAFAVASEIKALVCLPQVPRRLNEVRVADHLVPFFEDPTITFYQDIVRLPAAHSLRVSRQGVRLRRYWSLDPARELRLRSAAEYAEAFCELFSEAVRCRLRSIAPVGAMLSGGLDSSAIVCVARQLLAEGGGDRLRTFSAIFPSLEGVDRKIDERTYIAAVLAGGGVEPHYVCADRLSPLVGRVWDGDEALPTPNLYLDWALFQAVHHQGTRVLLSGWDGDSTVSHGYEYLQELARTGRWQTLAAEALALTRRLSGRPHKSLRVMWQLAFGPLLAEPWGRWWRRAKGRPHPEVEIIAPVHPAFAERIGLQQRLQAFLGPRSTPARSAREDHWRALTSGLLVYGLEVLEQVAAAWAIELRYPFCDRRLLEFCLALPPEQKLQDGWDRAIMRRALAAMLPQQVRERTRKGNLSANFKRRLLDDARETIEAVIRDDAAAIGRYVDVPAVRAAYQRYAAQPMQRQRDALAVFLVVTLALWLRTSTLSP